jgi:hypothetical protein
MTMRLEVAFPRPLPREDKLRVRFALSALAAVKRVVFVRGDQAAVVSGEALATTTVARALAEEGVRIASIATSLAAAGEADEAVQGAAKERYRPIGR